MTGSVDGQVWGAGDFIPVVEQAKGVLMATYRCGPEEAFDLLRRASQRFNVKVQVIAERVVERATSEQPPG